ncbi:MAG: hypothetical protein QG646_4559 [Euryarchaeota archaeon]|nr:hypothetical protein [Euryarchaeota archaeon]
MTMAGFLENILSSLKRKHPFLNKDYINPDVVTGVVMHIVIFIIILGLVLLLLQRLQTLLP